MRLMAGRRPSRLPAPHRTTAEWRRTGGPGLSSPRSSRRTPTWGPRTRRLTQRSWRRRGPLLPCGRLLAPHVGGCRCPHRCWAQRPWRPASPKSSSSQPRGGPPGREPQPPLAAVGAGGAALTRYGNSLAGGARRVPLEEGTPEARTEYHSALEAGLTGGKLEEAVFREERRDQGCSRRALGGSAILEPPHHLGGGRARPPYKGTARPGGVPGRGD
jgi:hypothetical protein